MDLLTERVYHVLRNRKNKPAGVVCVTTKRGKTSYGLTLLGTGDKFDYDFGASLAAQRAQRARNDDVIEEDWIIRDEAYKNLWNLKWEDHKLVLILFEEAFSMFQTKCSRLSLNVKDFTNLIKGGTDASRKTK